MFFMIEIILMTFFVLVAQTVRKEQSSCTMLSRELGVTGIPRCKGNPLSFDALKVILALGLVQFQCCGTTVGGVWNSSDGCRSG